MKYGVLLLFNCVICELFFPAFILLDTFSCINARKDDSYCSLFIVNSAIMIECPLVRLSLHLNLYIHNCLEIGANGKIFRLLKYNKRSVLLVKAVRCLSSISCTISCCKNAQKKKP